MTEQLTLPQKKKALLDAAQQLMMAKGYNATTVDDICKTAGVTKGSFFHYFKNKDDLGAAVLTYYWSQKQAAFEHAPFQEASDSLHRADGFIDFVTEIFSDPSQGQGCLVGTLAQELAITQPKFRLLCAQYFSEWAGFLESDLQALKDQDRLPADVNVSQLAEHFVAVLEGLLILAKAKQDYSLINQHKVYLKQLLFGVANANEVQI